MLLEEIAYIKTPGILFADNEGCEFLIKNKQVSSRTKYIDIIMHTIRKFCSENSREFTNAIVRIMLVLMLLCWWYVCFGWRKIRSMHEVIK